jgi:hypothetical protein
LANNTQLETEIKRLLKLNPQELEEALVSAIAKEDEVLAEMLPATEPPQSPKREFASFNLKEKIRRVKKALEQGIEKSRDGLYELVCVKLKYCEKRGKDELRLLASIVTGLMGKGVILVAYPKLWPIPAVVVYLHSNGSFDRLCKCPPAK